MQGNGKVSICSGKDVSGKFFEQVNITAKGNVSANAIMNCDITCEDAINVSGRFGIIVGGHVVAKREIEATLIGNMNETKTILEVGTKEDLYTKMNHLEQECKEIISELTKYTNNLEKMVQRLAENPENRELQEIKMNVMRTKIEKEAKLSDLEKQKEKVIEDCNALAVRYGYDKLKFVTGDVSTYTGEGNVDMVVTLHACDTATDYAIEKAVKWGAKVIFTLSPATME